MSNHQDVEVEDVSGIQISNK